MNLAKKYIKFVKDAHVIWTKLLILLPAGIVSFLFFPEIEYTVRLIISGTLCSIIVIIHFGIGLYSLSKKDYFCFVNFVVLPIFMGVFMLIFGYR
jgi:hypothetical protein